MNIKCTTNVINARKKLIIAAPGAKNRTISCSSSEAAFMGFVSTPFIVLVQVLTADMIPDMAITILKAIISLRTNNDFD